MSNVNRDAYAFSGFPKECVNFLISLRQNNNKIWFQDHKSDFENYVMLPAREFVTSMGELLLKLAPRIHADPRTDQSIFRIYRDTRFSQDKTPYKTHLGIWLWEGSRPKMENSGFYFHLEPPRMMLAVGVYQFTDEILKAYRDAVIHPDYGPELATAIQKVNNKKGYQIGGSHYKRVPSGYDAQHPLADLLLYRGLDASFEVPIPDELYTSQILEYCYNHYLDMLPVHRWLVNVLDASAQD